jgi:hypothetical protein
MNRARLLPEGILASVGAIQRMQDREAIATGAYIGPASPSAAGCELRLRRPLITREAFGRRGFSAAANDANHRKSWRIQESWPMMIRIFLRCC